MSAPPPQPQGFRQRFTVIWANCDPNRHMRHSAYADYAAHVRYAYFTQAGFSMERLQALAIGPILFREELVYRREIYLGDTIELDVARLGGRPDFSRWSLRTRVFRHVPGQDEPILAAVVNVDGAWLDLRTRKLTVPPADLAHTIADLPEAEDVVWQ